MTETRPAGRKPTVERALPLERKLPLLVLALFALVLAVSLAFSYYEVRHSAMELAAERLSSLSKVLTSLVEQQTTARSTLMHRVAHDTSIVQALRAPDQPPTAAAEKALSVLVASRTDSLRPALWTPDARPIGRLQLELPADQLPLRNDIRQVGASNDSNYISPFRSVGGRVVYWQAVPVRDSASHQLLGFIVHERQVAGSQRALEPLRDLVGSNIDVYFRSGSGTPWVAITGESIPAPVKAKPYLDSLVMFTHGDNEQMLAATATIRGTPIKITVEQSVSAILARPLAMMRVLIVIALVLAVFGAIVVWLLSRQVVRPLGELTRAAEGIADGRYAERVEVRGNDEIGRLGAAFNRMAQEVQVASNASELAVARLTRAAESQELLAEASRILAGSLSDETLLADLARYCVPALADYCTIHVADDEGSIRRIATAHHDPEREVLVQALVKRYEYRTDGPNEVATVIRTQRPLLLPHIDLDVVKSATDDETTLRLLDAVSPRSFLCVPLIARGRAFGAISFTMTESGRTFGTDDIDITTELSRRTAVAIDNAVIYRRSLALRMEAEAASSAKSDFLAKMSHEIRTPINAMMGYAELLQMGISGAVTEAQSKQLQRIRASGDHLTSLVNEILDLAKIEAGRMGVQPTVGLAGDAAESALTLIRPQAATKGIELANHADGTPHIEYFGDPQRVQQILTNLLSNAVKFTPSGGRVSIHCGLGQRPDAATDSSATPWACISIFDTGVGVNPSDLERIFQPFVQADAGYTRAHGGTGLGLTISRSLAQMMGGEISVESVPGEGSRFTLWLPCPVRVMANV